MTDRLAKIERLLKIAKGDLPPNRLDRIENMLEDTDMILNLLLDRHQALSESIEIMVHEGQKLQQLVAKHERRIAKLEGKK